MMGKALLWASTYPLLAERLPQYGFVKRATRLWSSTTSGH